MYILENEKIGMRFIEIDDIYNGWLEMINDPDHTATMITSGPVTEQDLVNFHNKNQLPNAAMFAVFEKKSFKYIGNVKISNFDWSKKTGVFGRMLNKKYHDQGFGKSMTYLILKYGFLFLNLNKIISGSFKSNTKALRSNISCGMNVVGHDYVNDMVRLEIDRVKFDQVITLRDK